MPKDVKLSIIILNFNTKNFLKDCLESLAKVNQELNMEIIVIDNGSNDGSYEMVEDKYKDFILIRNKENLGFAAGINQAKNICKGEYILFLNPDTLVYPNILKETVNYLGQHLEIGALTCKVVLPNGQLDKDTRRAFITPWIGLTHLFLRLDRIFPKSKLFSQYWYGYKSENEIHEVDALQGAFFLVRKKILDEVGWFDEDYFLDGEDIDLSWKIKQKGWKIIYYPKVSILHYKGISKGKNLFVKVKIPLKEKVKYRVSGVNSMELFYKKHLWKRYPLVLSILIILGIKVLKIIRVIRLIIFG